jgi:hypothetical protein
MDPVQEERFLDAVQRKEEEARRKARQHLRTGPPPRAEDMPEIQPSLVDDSRTQDVGDPRVKSSRHRHVTADNWNQ